MRVEGGTAAAQGPPGRAVDAPARRLDLGWWTAIPLWRRVFAALTLGVVVALIWGPGAAHVRWLGDIFIRLTRMVVAPLVFVTITAGVISLGDPKRLGSLGARTIGMFVFSATIAGALGMTLGQLLHPGVGVNMSGARPQIIKASQSLGDQLLGIIPLNPVKALADGDMLALVFFAVFLGAGILASGERGAPLAAAFASAAEVMGRLVGFIMEAAPFGVFGLIAAAVGANGPGVFVHVSLLAIGVAVGCALLTFVIQPILVRLLTGLPPLAYLRGVLDVILVALSTSSSSASLPAEMAAARDNLGIRGPVLSTVLPLGVSIGRDGSALYVTLLSNFTAQALGLHLDLGHYLLMWFAASLVALSAPPVPSAALFMMAAVLSVVGVPDTETAIVVGFILPFDRVLDMLRTVPNVTSNLVATTVIAGWAGDLDADVFRAPPEKRS